MMKQSIPNKKKKKHSIPKELPSQIILEILSRLPHQNPLPLPTRFQALAFSNLRSSLRQSPPLKITSQPLAQTLLPQP
ncbi:hypothetical protein ACSBR1_012154 [Camellia fascicularis]